jgi:hypothetical protein
MTTKKFYTTLNIIADMLNKSRPDSVDDNLWIDLYNSSVTFRHFLEGHTYAKYVQVAWSKKFLRGMARTANQPSQWRWVCRSFGSNSPEWDTAIKKLFDSAKKNNSLYEWRQLRRILPQDHKYRMIACDRISHLTKIRQTKNKK